MISLRIPLRAIHAERHTHFKPMSQIVPQCPMLRVSSMLRMAFYALRHPFLHSRPFASIRGSRLRQRPLNAPYCITKSSRAGHRGTEWNNLEHFSRSSHRAPRPAILTDQTAGGAELPWTIREGRKRDPRGAGPSRPECCRWNRIFPATIRSG